MDNSMKLSTKDIRILIPLVQWADPKDGCDLICRIGEWKIEDLSAVQHPINHKWYAVPNSFVRTGGRKTEGLNGYLEDHRWVT